MKKILLLPDWMRSLEFYNSHTELNIRIGKLTEQDMGADCIIGLSLGALIVLQKSNQIKGRIVLVNPPLPKRAVLHWVIRWVTYITTEGLFLERQKFTRNPIRWITALINCAKLLSFDFSSTLDNIPKERLLIIRGTNDNFFCDKTTAELIRSKGIVIHEVTGGHNWSEAIETMVSM